MRCKSYLSSIAFRLPFAIFMICGLVTVLALATIFGLTQAEVRMSEYRRVSVTRLSMSHAISNKVSSLLATAPFLINTNSTYRMANEWRSISEEIDDLAASLRASHADDGIDPLLSEAPEKGLEALMTIRREMENLVVNANQAQACKAQASTLFTVLKNEGRGLAADPADSAHLKQIAMSVVMADNLLQLGELRRQYVAIRRSRSGAGMDPAGLRPSRLYDELFETQQNYLGRMSAVRSALTRLRIAAQDLVEATEERVLGTGENLKREIVSAAGFLGYMREVILAALIVVFALGVTMIRRVMRISRAITAISESMRTLTEGGSVASLPPHEATETELRNLVEAFAAFQASVNRLAQLRSTAQIAARTIRSTFRSMHEGIAIFDRDGRPVTMNRRIMDLAGQGSRKSPAREFVSGLDDIDAALFPAGPCEPGTLDAPLVLRSRNAKGEILEISLSRQPDRRIVMLVRDVSDAVRRENDARQTQRLDAAMRMAHKVSHEVGNMIGIITGSLGLLEKGPQLNEAQQRHLARMRKAAERGKSLASSMLSAASRQILAPERSDIAALLVGMQDVLETACGDACVITLAIEPALQPICLDPAMFEQVVLNLCLNAAAAMPAGGRIAISAEHRQTMVSVRVCDEGVGMTPEVAERAFEPYFSTKTNGNGAGLGLAVVYGFVHQSHGKISIHTRPGEGTCVEMLFPRFDQDCLGRKQLIELKEDISGKAVPDQIAGDR